MYGTVDRIPPRPRWVSLYVLVASMLALFGAADGFVPVGALRRALEVAVAIIMFGTIHLWVHANRRALELAGARDAGFRTIAPDGDAAPFDRPVAPQVTDVRDRKRRSRPQACDTSARRATPCHCVAAPLTAVGVLLTEH